MYKSYFTKQFNRYRDNGLYIKTIIQCTKIECEQRENEKLTIFLSAELFIEKPKLYASIMLKHGKYAEFIPNHA